jgi:hypothetical protein
MADQFPVFIGITGKREFSDDPDTAKHLEAIVRQRIAETIDHIDALVLDTPKILLTGAATGADLIAAEAVLGLGPAGAPAKSRRNWLVVAVLPFEEELYRQDFTADEWARFERVAADPRTRRWVLPPLKTPDGTRSTTGELERRPDSSEDDKELRRRHYEQVGLWIIDTANILLAVMSADERADKVGGTARIVACRRGGRPDPVAAEVIFASAVLAPRNDLHRPASGYAWLIDPAHAPLCARPPVTVLPPARDNMPWEHVYARPGSLALSSEEDVRHRWSAPTQTDHLKESQRLLTIARGYSADGAAAKAAGLQAWPESDDATKVVTDISAGLRRPTNAAARRYRVVANVLVAAFLLAVLVWEMFVEFPPPRLEVLTLYCGITVIILVLYFIATRKELQPVAEDRRAIREVLRVQAAWWHAGLADRVDQVYLVGADHDLSRVRQAARNVIAYALLAGRMRQPPANWRAVFDPTSWPRFRQDLPGPQFPRDWVGNQLYYFRQRKTQRRHKGELIEALSWSVFATSLWVAATLVAGMAFMEGPPNLGLGAPNWVLALATLGVVTAAGVFWWVGGWLLAEVKWRWHRAPLAFLTGAPPAGFLFVAVQIAAALAAQKTEWIAAVETFLAPVAVYAIYSIARLLRAVLAGQSLDPNDAHPIESVFRLCVAVLVALAGTTAVARSWSTHESALEIAHAMTAVLVIFLPALAGAMRFMAEKFAIEAEALSYRDGHIWFEHGRELLSAAVPGEGDELADARGRFIIRNLGALALRENESWLKTRRQRPLSPVIGG